MKVSHSSTIWVPKSQKPNHTTLDHMTNLQYSKSVYLDSGMVQDGFEMKKYFDFPLNYFRRNCPR